MFGHRISHAHNLTNRRWNINLQTVRAVVHGAAKKIRVCTSCIKNGKVQKAAGNVPSPCFVTLAALHPLRSRAVRDGQ
jgi:large subunit ribosomal protein L28